MNFLQKSLTFTLMVALTSCSAPTLFKSKAYKSGVDAGRQLNTIQESTDTVASWAKVFGANESQIDQVAGKENCENVWIISGLIYYHLKNTEKNHKDFIEGCKSIVGEA